MAMERIYVTEPRMILKAGHQGENLARCICFPLTSLVEQYGEGTWTIVFRRPFESDPYVVANQEEVGEYAVWGLDATDTAVCGEGRVELRYYVDDVLCKTDVYAVSLLPSLGTTGDAPSPYEDIIDAVAGYAAEARDAVASVPETVAELQAELDEAISGVTVDSEVINARVGADATTYSTLKQRLDTEHTDLKNQILQTRSDDNGNLRNAEIIINTFVQGKRGDNAEVGQDAARCTTELYYSLKEGDEISISNVDSGIRAAIMASDGSSNIYNSSFKTADFSYVVASGKSGLYFVNVAKTTSGASISPSDINTLTVRVVNAPLLLEAKKVNSISKVADESLQCDVAGTGYGINYSNGNTAQNDNLSYTKYIDISAYQYIEYRRVMQTADSPANGIAFYNAAKSYISGIRSKGGQEELGYESGLYEAKVPDNAKYVRFTMLSDTETYDAFEAYGIFTICKDIREIKSDISEIVEDNELNYKNLAGLDANVFYPVDIPAGTYVVMSTADGEKINQRGLNLYFYDENKNSLGYYNFTSSNASRSVNAPGSVKTRYLKWDSAPNREVQVEIGNVKTTYVPYHYPVGKRISQLESDIGTYISNEIFNGEPYSGVYDWQTPVVAYGALFNETENVEAFGFFTDPHVMGFTGRNETNMKEYIKKVSRVFRSVPCPYFVCGGDWLNNSTVMDEACYRLGYIKALARNMLCDCKMVIGNHDTNYQGKETVESENGTGRLTDATIAALMFNDTNTRKAYYSFDGIRSKCYVLDTGIEHSTMLAYDWEQVAWLAENLAEDDPTHAIIFLHIITNSGSVQKNTSNFAALVQAYNGHTTVELNGIAYDFTRCSGHVDFWVGGHTHVDSTGTLGGIPYMITASNGYTSDVPLIDLVLVDYDNNAVKTIRVGGTGSDRTISLS